MSLFKPVKLTKAQGALWDSIQTAFDKTLYKKCLKICDELSRTYSGKGDILAYKAFINYTIEKKRKKSSDEISTKEIDALSEKYPNCGNVWYVKGYLSRLQSNYKIALEAQEKAVLFQPKHLEGLNELSNLRAYSLDFPGFLRAAQTIFNTDASASYSWTKLFIAHFLNGNYEKSTNIIDGYLRTLRSKVNKFTMSQIYLFKSVLLMKQDQHLKALSLLVDNAKIVDRTSSLEQQAILHAKMNNTDSLLSIFTKLYEKNPYRLFYLAGLAYSKGILLPADGSNADLPHYLFEKKPTKIATLAETREFFQDLRKKYPKSQILPRAPLDLIPSSDPSFKSFVHDWAGNFVARGIPGSSIWSDIKSIHSPRTSSEPDTTKLVILAEIMEDMLSQLENWKSSDFEKTSSASNGSDANDANGSISTTSKRILYGHKVRNLDNSVLSIRGFLGLLYSYFGQNHRAQLHLGLALDSVERKLSTIPKHQDIDAANMFSIYATFLANQGDWIGATYSHDKAAATDLDDRYVNTKSAERWLIDACNDMRARELVNLFIGSINGKPVRNELFQMQAIWWDVARLACFEKSFNIPFQIQAARAIFHNFDSVYKDHYHYHHYSTVKLSLVTYISMIDHQKIFFGHPYYRAAVVSITRAFLTMKSSSSITEYLKTYKIAENSLPANHSTTRPAPKYPVGENTLDSLEKDVLEVIPKYLSQCPNDPEILSLYAVFSLACDKFLLAFTQFKKLTSLLKNDSVVGCSTPSALNTISHWSTTLLVFVKFIKEKSWTLEETLSPAMKTFIQEKGTFGIDTTSSETPITDEDGSLLPPDTSEADYKSLNTTPVDFVASKTWSLLSPGKPSLGLAKALPKPTMVPRILKLLDSQLKISLPPPFQDIAIPSIESKVEDFEKFIINIFGKISINLNPRFIQEWGEFLVSILKLLYQNKDTNQATIFEETCLVGMLKSIQTKFSLALKPIQSADSKPTSPTLHLFPCAPELLTVVLNVVQLHRRRFPDEDPRSVSMLHTKYANFFPWCPILSLTPSSKTKFGELYPCIFRDKTEDHPEGPDSSSASSDQDTETEQETTSKSLQDAAMVSDLVERSQS